MDDTTKRVTKQPTEQADRTLARGARIRLDRSRLLGFDQTEPDDRHATSFSKVGGKTMGPKRLAQLGGKIGGKGGIKQTDRTR